MNDYISLESPQSSKCDLDCVYCYIPKNKVLKDIHKKWQSLYSDGTYNELISEAYDREKLEAISFWGGEPSLGFGDLQKLRDLFILFPNLKSFSTSTNCSNFESIKFLLEEVSKYSIEFNRNSKVSIQISLDGEKDRNDRNRGKGVYDRVIKNTSKILETAKSLEKVHSTIFFKQTNTSEDFLEYSNSPESLIRTIGTFDKLHSDFISKYGSYKNMTLEFRSLPTIAWPGSYSKKDGETYTKCLKLVEEVIRDKFPNWAHTNPLYSGRIRSLIKEAAFINREKSNDIFFCSAGSKMIGLDPDGTTHGCHGSFWSNYIDYLKTNESLGDWCSGERIMDYSTERFWKAEETYISQYRDSYNDARMKYVLRSFSHNLDNYLNITYATVKMLLLAEQISEIFLQEEWARFFTYFIALKSSCWFNNVLVCSSPSVTPLSLYRVYGNGAFEYLVKDLIRREA